MKMQDNLTNPFTKRIYLRLLIIFFVGINAYTVLGKENFYLENNIDNLSESHNEFIKMDSKNLVWISSINGVYCYNSSNWKYYPLPFDGNVQSNFFEDKNGDIWVATYKAIHKYSRISDEFYSFQLLDTAQNNIGYHIFHLEQDGLLWLKINETIYTYNPSNRILTKKITSKGTRFEVSVNKSGKVKKIIACPWFLNQGFEIIDIMKNGTIKRQKYFEEETLEVNGATIDLNKGLYLSTRSGLVYWNKNKPEKITQIPHPFEINSPTRKGIIINKNQLLIPFKYLTSINSVFYECLFPLYSL